MCVYVHIYAHIRIVCQPCSTSKSKCMHTHNNKTMHVTLHQVPDRHIRCIHCQHAPWPSWCKAQSYPAKPALPRPQTRPPQDPPAHAALSCANLCISFTTLYCCRISSIVCPTSTRNTMLQTLTHKPLLCQCHNACSTVCSQCHNACSTICSQCHNVCSTVCSSTTTNTFA